MIKVIHKDIQNFKQYLMSKNNQPQNQSKAWYGAKQKSIAIFEHEPVRRVWVGKDEQWYFSIIDVIRVLTGSVDSAAYWRKLKQRLKEEGNQTVTNCHGFKILAPECLKRSCFNEN